MTGRHEHETKVIGETESIAAQADTEPEAESEAESEAEPQAKAEAAVADTADESNDDTAAVDESTRGIDWARVLAYGILPGLALILALTAGYLKFVDNSVRNGDVARVESMQAAKDSTIVLLSYTPDKVEQQLGDARNLMTGEFKESYTALTNDVVIPGAKEQQISAVATVPALASISAEPDHAVVLVFVDQTVVIGAGTPTDTASSVRVTLDKVAGDWLISGFDPV